MSGPLPSLTASQVVAALQRRGFVPHRQSGSHLVLRHPDGRRTTVPMHKARDLSKGTIRGILSDIGLTIDQLLAR
jgi:predicted RNA binding protein YcfA (HicA-like mRNA interferase family)